MNTSQTMMSGNIEPLYAFMERYNFVTFITHHSDKQLHITHLPILLDRTQGQQGTIVGHLAKRNPQAMQLTSCVSALCIFHGPHAYISPNWYQTALAVPTWNYAIIHAHGIPSVISKEQLQVDLTKMVELHEAKLTISNRYTISETHEVQLLEHIVGFRMEITKIEQRFKLGQNRSQEDQASMLQALQSQETFEAKALADFIQSLKS